MFYNCTSIYDSTCPKSWLLNKMVFFFGKQSPKSNLETTNKQGINNHFINHKETFVFLLSWVLVVGSLSWILHVHHLPETFSSNPSYLHHQPYYSSSCSMHMFHPSSSCIPYLLIHAKPLQTTKSELWNIRPLLGNFRPLLWNFRLPHVHIFLACICK